MPARTLRRKKPARAAKRPARARKTLRSSAKKRTVSKVKAKMPKMKIAGRVIHYYDRIAVAIVELAAPLRIGDTVLFKRGDQEVSQYVDSMQINHVPVELAKKKQVIGLKVSVPVQEGALMFPG